MVEIVGDVIALRLRHPAHASAFGQILSQQAVEVLVAAAFPCVIRRGEVDLEREALFEQGVVVKFGAVVERERLKLAAMTADGARCRLRYRVLVARTQLLDDRVAGLAFYQREHAMAHVTVTLPRFHVQQVMQL